MVFPVRVLTKICMLHGKECRSTAKIVGHGSGDVHGWAGRVDGRWWSGRRCAAPWSAGRQKPHGAHVNSRHTPCMVTRRLPFKAKLNVQPQPFTFTPSRGTFPSSLTHLHVAKPSRPNHRSSRASTGRSLGPKAETTSHPPPPTSASRGYHRDLLRRRRRPPAATKESPH